MEQDKTILCVDDESIVLECTAMVLQLDGHVVLTAQGAEEGLGILAERSVDLVVTDHSMPEMNGIPFLERVAEVHPDTRRILVSGVTTSRETDDALATGIVHAFVPKPWGESILRDTVREWLR